MTRHEPLAFAAALSDARRRQFECWVDPLSLALLAHLRRVAPSQACVLLEGEPGSGQEFLARRLHDAGPRRDRAYCSVHCGAFAPQDLERELFGCEKGALPGAFVATPGWLEQAQGGTLFLDEIERLPLPLQARLLQLLQTGTLLRVGGREPRPADVRLVAATGCELVRAVGQGSFRADLFHALRAAPVKVPALRERPGDILPLAEHFIRHHRQQLGCGPVQLGPAARQRLLAHDWPGNVRELESVVHHALLLCSDGEIGAEHLVLSALATPAPVPAAAPAQAPPGLQALEDALTALCRQRQPGLQRHVEATLLTVAFRECAGHQVRTAALLGWSRNVLRGRLIEHRLISARK